MRESLIMLEERKLEDTIDVRDLVGEAMSNMNPEQQALLGSLEALKQSARRYKRILKEPIKEPWKKEP